MEESEVGRKPARDDRGRNGGEAFRKDGVDTGVPGFMRADFRASVAENEFVKAGGRVLAEPHSGLAAHGKAAEVDTIEVKGVEEIEDVVCESLDGIRPRWCGRLAVAARSVAEKATARRECRELRIPHGEICAERTGQYEDGTGVRAGEGVVNANVVEIGERHRSTFCGTL